MEHRYCVRHEADRWHVSLVADDLSATFGTIRVAAKSLRCALCTYRGETGPDRCAAAKQSLGGPVQ
jgi:hypothetical protein